MIKPAKVVRVYLVSLATDVLLLIAVGRAFGSCFVVAKIFVLRNNLEVTLGLCAL